MPLCPSLAVSLGLMAAGMGQAGQAASSLVPDARSHVCGGCQWGWGAQQAGGLSTGCTSRLMKGAETGLEP